MQTTSPASNQCRAVDDLVLLAIIVAVFGRTLVFGFVDWDDLIYTLTNPLVKHPLSEGPMQLLLTPRMGYPMPLTVLLRHLAFRLGDGAAWPFHLSNLLFHAASALMAARLLAGWGLSRRAATLAAALWACHPIVAEPVAWVTGGKDVVAVTFVLAGLLAFRRATESRDRAAGWAAAFVAASILAIAAKPTAAVLPGMALAEALIFRRRLSRALVVALVLSLGLAFAGLAAAYVLHDRHGGHNAARSVGDCLLFVGEHLALQLRNYAAPVALAARYPEGLPRPLASAWGAAGVGALAALGIVSVLVLRRRTPLARWLLAVFLLGFLPVSGVVALNRGPSDSYLYLSSLALAAAMVAGVEHLCRMQPRLASGWPTAALVATLAFAGFVQAGIWRTSVALWSNQVDLYPDAEASWANYGDALMDRGRVRDAMGAYEQALARFPYPPPDPRSLVNLGQGWALLGDGARSTRWYGEAVRHYPPSARHALRLLAAAAAQPDPAYAAEVQRARGSIERALLKIASVPAREREARVRAFYDRHLASDGIALRALELLSADPQVREVAAALLERGRTAPAAPGRLPLWAPARIGP